MNFTTTAETQNHSSLSNTVSWDAVFAGTIAAIVIGSLFNLLGISFGLLALNPDSNSLVTFSVMTVIWILLSTLIYAFLGGWIAAYFSASTKRINGILHGFLAWSLSTIFTLIVISSAAGFLLNAGAQVVSNTIKLSSQVASQTLQITQLDKIMVTNQDIGLDKIKQQINALFNPNDPSSSLKSYEVMLNVKELLLTNNADRKNQLRESIVNQLVKDNNMDRNKAVQVVGQVENTYNDAQQQLSKKIEEAKQKGSQMVNKASDVLGSVTLVFLFALLSGVAASAVGGYLGASKKDPFKDNNKSQDVLGNISSL